MVWSSVSKEDILEMGAVSKETHGILDELFSTIPDADVHILFTELEEGGLKASLRSSDAVNVSSLAAKTYGGGGHARAAGFRVQSEQNFGLQVLECVQTLKEAKEADESKEAPAFAPDGATAGKEESKESSASTDKTENDQKEQKDIKDQKETNDDIDIVSTLTEGK